MRTESMTPLELEICLWYNSRCEDMPWVMGDAPIRDRVVGELIDLGLLRETPKSDTTMRYGPTDKLHAFISMLCKTPLPALSWVNPVTNEHVLPADFPQ